MDYAETIDFLYSKLPMFSRQGASAYKKDLTNIRLLCEVLGNPQKQFKSIHVAGTNGKGSVCHMLAAVLQQSGYKTGLHTSPHLLDFRERIRINGGMAAKEFVVDFVENNQELIKRVQPSFFELSVAMAFSWFAINKVEVAVVEVGLGGRLDSTNILEPELAVITNISLDHTKLLGSTRKEIAGEKAGIIKRGTPVVIGETDAETAPVFTEKAMREQAPIYFADQMLAVRLKKQQPGGQWVSVENLSDHLTEEFKLDLSGNYQASNLRTVVCAVEVLREKDWHLDKENTQKALRKVKKSTGLRGRWEVLKHHPLVVADVGHNVAGIQEIMNQIRATSFDRLFIITGFVKDKNVAEALSLYPKEATYFFCQADNPRALPAEALMEVAQSFGLEGNPYPSVKAAYQTALKAAAPADMILVCGSTFVVAEILRERGC